METIKVNMSPNPLDVQTIHASQNDGEARQWEFELHNNGELIDTSEITEQLFFKAYKGGTEQILPENTSTPTTSPFLGDIRYPQGLLTDQEFTYRQSPTEEDGLAKITDVKGNTLVWNQLNQNGNYVSTSGLTTWGCTISASNNILTFKATNHSGNYAHPFLNLVSGHKYLVGVTIQKEKAEEMIRYGFEYGYNRTFIADNITTKKRYFQIVESTYTGSAKLYIASATSPSYTDFGNVYVSDYVCFDLTQMGLDISSPSGFTSLFPLSYYSYNQGTLLSFMGNGIKTTGKNLLETATSGSVSGVTFTVNNDGSITVNGTATSNGTYDFYRNTSVLPSWAKLGQTYTLSLTNPINRFSVHSYDSSGTVTALVDTSTASRVFTIPNNAVGLLIRIFVTSGVTYDVIVYPQIEIGTSATSYEPYTSSTLSLPISTYFPTGMKSAGNAYDELTPRKAITRIGALNIDSSTTIATWESNDGWTANIDLNGYKPNGAIKSDKFEYIGSFNGASSFATSAKAKGGYCLGIWENSNRVYFYSSSATTANDLINAIRGTNLYYELATPTETSFTTASLVTENAEIPLSNEDGVLIGKCTDQLSAEPGFHDAKIKLSDSDGTCYSNKLQLHVERSPQ